MLKHGRLGLGTPVLPKPQILYFVIYLDLEFRGRVRMPFAAAVLFRRKW